jgi:pimeloyl-ACP methyl ester carboxylesterase
MTFPRKLLGGAVAVAAALVAASARARRAAPPELPPPGSGEAGHHPWRHAELFITRAGSGPPALLIHDLYAGASGDEMAPLAQRLSVELETVLLDLPGFGRSGHPRLRYGPDLFFDAIVELVRHGIDAPVLLIGSGLSAAYATEAAIRLGRLVTGVVLIAPPEPQGPAVIESPSWRPLAYQLLRSPIGEAYHMWRSSASRRRGVLLRDLAVEPQNLDERAERLHRYARQRDARWPLWSLWAGDLAWDPRAALSRLGAPALVVWGAEARANAAAPDAYHAVRPDLPQEVIPGTARWPHLDAPDRVAEVILEWWAREGTRPESEEE